MEHGIIGFWTSFAAGIFILLHLPTCDYHWADRLKTAAKYLRKYNKSTLNLAALLALVHIILSLIGLISGVWL